MAWSSGVASPLPRGLAPSLQETAPTADKQTSQHTPAYSYNLGHSRQLSAAKTHNNNNNNDNESTLLKNPGSLKPRSLTIIKSAYTHTSNCSKEPSISISVSCGFCGVQKRDFGCLRLHSGPLHGQRIPPQLPKQAWEAHRRTHLH